MAGIVDSLQAELSDAGSFRTLSQDAYLRDSAARRNVERWVENLVNASIDIAKILLASRRQRVPQTYREIPGNLKGLAGFDPLVSEKLAAFSKLRNILAHEYLDVHWSAISKFLQEGMGHPAYLSDFVEQLLSARGRQS